MVLFRTEFNGNHAVKFSPFRENQILVATAQNFGIVGSGKCYVLELAPNGQIIPVTSFYTKDGLYDCTWSEENEFHAIGVSGDGTIKLWDIRSRDGNPLKTWQEHTQEIYGVDWNLQSKDSFITSSWDKAVKLWSPLQDRSIRTFDEHQYNVYSAMWDPRSAQVFASASGDHTTKTWDLRVPTSVSTLVHPAEVLTLDWNKYQEFAYVTGCVDKAIRMWDLRNPRQPITELYGHQYAVRKVKCSPHNEKVIASVSYDRSYCLWDLSRPGDPLVERSEHHTEFCVGLDFNLFIEGMIATCGWDSFVAVWKIGTDPTR
jgi:peroxin-7